MTGFAGQNPVRRPPGGPGLDWIWIPAIQSIPASRLELYPVPAKTGIQPLDRGCIPGTGSTGYWIASPTSGTRAILSRFAPLQPSTLNPRWISDAYHDSWLSFTIVHRLGCMELMDRPPLPDGCRVNLTSPPTSTILYESRPVRRHHASYRDPQSEYVRFRVRYPIQSLHHCPTSPPVNPPGLPATVPRRPRPSPRPLPPTTLPKHPF